MYNFVSSACVSRNLKCYDFYVSGLYELYVNRVREKELRDLFLPQDGVVFDVGARIGAWTLPSIALGNMTYAFEPVYESFKQLQDNISLNNYEEYAFPVNVAVSDIDGVKPFSYAKNPSRALQLSKAAITESSNQYVQTITLDSFIQQQHIEEVDFIKIDVEGEELAVINGSINVIANMMPDMIIENHDDNKVSELINRVNELAEYRVVKNVKSTNHAIDHTSHTIFLG